MIVWYTLYGAGFWAALRSSKHPRQFSFSFSLYLSLNAAVLGEWCVSLNDFLIPFHILIEERFSVRLRCWIEGPILELKCCDCIHIFLFKCFKPFLYKLRQQEYDQSQVLKLILLYRHVIIYWCERSWPLNTLASTPGHDTCAFIKMQKKKFWRSNALNIFTGMFWF